MCLNPISIINPSKYVSLSYKDRYLLQVPCGVCADCQKQLSNQWNYRTYYEFADCIRSGGFIYYTTLSYDNRHLPHVNELLPDAGYNFSCFRKSDVTNFLKNLRIKLDRQFGCKIRYFLSTEYGHDQLYRDSTGKLRKGTNRPHYHVLFFVYNSNKIKENQTKSNNIFLTFSKLISSCWSYGLTDDAPYRSSAYVMQHNVISTNTIENVLRTANYITKYVQKSCEFKETIDKRVMLIMRSYAKKYAPDKQDEWLSSPAAARIRCTLNSMVNQFHRQSLHYGESALSEMDISDLFDKGYLVMPHYKSVKVKVAIPTYYKRKLFYRLLEIDGQKTWQLNELGVEYRDYRIKRHFDTLVSQFQAVCIQHHLNYDCKALADYVLYDRGRIKADVPSRSFEDKFKQLDLFNYVTMTDKENLSCRGLLPEYLGNCVSGYKIDVMPPHITIRQFIDKYVILNPEKEKELSTIYYYISYVDKGRQLAYQLEQKLRNKLKCLI